MKPIYSIEDVVPHAGTMSLLDDIVDTGKETLLARVNLNPDTLFAESKGVPAWIGIEYMAQAVAAYAGVQARDHGDPVRIGFLVGSRRYLCSHSYFPLGESLEVSVHKELQADNGLGVFHCAIRCGEVTASASLNVFQPEDAEEFLQDERNKEQTRD